MTIVWCSSCSPDLWKPSGKPLLDSFEEHAAGVDGSTMVFTHEGDADRIKPERFSEAVRFVDMEQGSLLAEWLNDPRTLEKTPYYLGGRAQPCRCPGTKNPDGSDIRHAKHRHRCHWQWMNRNATRWWRKVVTYNVALEACDELGSDLLAWVDADGQFVRPGTEDHLRQMLNGKAFGYARAHRPAPETGFLVFDLQAGGREFIRDLTGVYLNHRIWEFERWDDGALVGELLDESWAVRAQELVPRGSVKQNNVLPLTACRRFYVHDKGRHGRKQNIVR